MPTELTPAQIGLIQSRNAAAQGMVYAVANTGSGQYLPAVERYQQVWNTARQASIAQLRLVAPDASAALIRQLVEDGQYGPGTASTLHLIIGDPRPPTRASGMPVWFAQNQDRVAQLVPIQVQPVETLIEPVAARPNPMSEQVVDQAANSGAMAQEIIGPDVGPSATPDAPAIVAASTAPGELIPEVEELQAGPPEVVEFEEERVVERPTQYSFETDIPILATSRRGLYPFVALGVGAAALGGVLYYFTRRGGGRRRYA